jgi:glycosyltransferase involved in cell wall biosynthesis
VRLALLMPRSSPWAIELAMHLAGLGHDVHAVTFTQGGSRDGYMRGREDLTEERLRVLSDRGTTLHEIDSAFTSGLRYFTAVPGLRRILRTVRPDALLALYGGGLATMACLSGFRPYAVYAVGSDVHLVSGARRALTAWTFRQAGCVFANGEHLAEATRLLSPRARVVPLYMGASTAEFTPGTPPATPVRIVCTRGFESVYNNEYLIRGLAAMPDPGVEYEVRFLGPGPLLNESRALANRILPAERRRRVRFWGGLPWDEVRRELRSAHVYVSLSLSDGTSTSLLEAMSCGLFPVLSDIPANREWIAESRDNGILVPLHWPMALGHALARAIRGRAWRERVAAANRALVVERADSATNLAMLAEYMERVVTAPDEAPAAPSVAMHNAGGAE